MFVVNVLYQLNMVHCIINGYIPYIPYILAFQLDTYIGIYL